MRCAPPHDSPERRARRLWRRSTRATLGEAATHRLALRGEIADLRAASGIDLRLRAQTTGVALPGLPPGLPPLRINARLRDGASGYRLDDLELDVADSRVRRLTAAQRAAASGCAARPAVVAADRSGANWAPPGDAKPRTPERQQLAALDLDLDFKIGRLVLPGGRLLQAGSGRLTLERGKLSAKALQATVGGAKVVIDGSIADPQQVAGIELDVSLQGGELAELIKFFGHPVAPLGAYQAAPTSTARAPRCAPARSSCRSVAPANSCWPAAKSTTS